MLQETVDNNELRIGGCSLAKGFEDLEGILIAPVVQNRTQDEDARVLLRLRREEVVG